MMEVHLEGVSPLDDEAALEWLQAQPGGHVEITVSALARQWGWGRSKLRRRLDAWVDTGVITRGVTSQRKSIISVVDTIAAESNITPVSTKAPVQNLVECAHTIALPRAVTRHTVQALGARVRHNLLSGAVFVLGAGAASVGLALNVSSLWSFGRTSDARIFLASIGLVIDCATLILPSVIAGLFARGRGGLATLAIFLWVIAATMTVFVLIGFATANIGDTVMERGGAMAQRTGIVEMIEQLKAERRRLPSFVPTRQEGVAAAQTAVALAMASRDQACTGRGRYCLRREAELAARQSEFVQAQKDKAATDQAAVLDTRLREAQATLGSLAVVAQADPQIEGAIQFVAWISGGRIASTPTDMNMLRIVGLAALPLLGGLFLPLGLALREPLKSQDTANCASIRCAASSDG